MCWEIIERFIIITMHEIKAVDSTDSTAFLHNHK
jgi:hypothetical protein